jgi:hypothetical protein
MVGLLWLIVKVVTEILQTANFIITRQYKAEERSIFKIAQPILNLRTAFSLIILLKMVERSISIKIHIKKILPTVLLRIILRYITVELLI